MLTIPTLRNYIYLINVRLECLDILYCLKDGNQVRVGTWEYGIRGVFLRNIRTVLLIIYLSSLTVPISFHLSNNSSIDLLTYT